MVFTVSTYFSSLMKKSNKRNQGDLPTRIFCVNTQTQCFKLKKIRVRTKSPYATALSET